MLIVAHLQDFKAVLRDLCREAERHPAILAAIIMRPMGYRWQNHRWVSRWDNSCPHCDGGAVPDEDGMWWLCKRCEGTGRVLTDEEVTR